MKVYYVQSLHSLNRISGRLKETFSTALQKEKPLENPTRSTYGWEYSSDTNYEAVVQWHEKGRVIWDPVKAGRGLSRPAASSVLAPRHLARDWKMNIHAVTFRPSAPGARLVALHCNGASAPTSLQTLKLSWESNCRNKVPIIPVIGGNKATRLLLAPPRLRHIFKSPI